jgi:DNA-directed RNA polymerase subunit beta
LPSRSAARERFSFANIDEVLPLPDLVAIQRDSFKWFLEHGLAETFRDISPIEDFTGQLRLELEFDATDEDLLARPATPRRSARRATPPTTGPSSYGPAS